MKQSSAESRAGVVRVTTSRRATEPEIARARELARRLALPFVPRTGPLRPDEGAALVVTKDKLVIETAGGPLFFHPGMAKPRIAALRQGRRDVMAEAMGLERGMTVLDATLGLGADALVASYVAGPDGKVVGLEAVPALAEVVRVGLAGYVFPQPDIVEAMRRIEVICAEHGEFLARQPDDSFDVVYFDPLFEHPVEESVHMQPWRELGRKDPLARAVVEEARRVARRRVVVKERSHSPLFARLGIEKLTGGKGSRIAYGVLEAAP